MQPIEGILDALPRTLSEAVCAHADDLRELRLRAGQRPQLVLPAASVSAGDRMDVDELSRVAGALMEFSLYAWEDELSQGFFTVRGGCRVGVCGRYALRDGRPVALTALNAICIRIAREVPGCAASLTEYVCSREGLKSLLVVSRPGLGKTTCLRDLARQISDRGYNVALADERGEIAALQGGVPTLKVGERTDVMDMCPKHIAVPHMLRSMAPDVIITDELGDARDAAAINEARRCGVAVVASVHAGSLDQAFSRPAMAGMSGAFEIAALLDKAPGCVAEIRRLEGEGFARASARKVESEIAGGFEWKSG